jgi:hypothetical protein
VEPPAVRLFSRTRLVLIMRRLVVTGLLACALGAGVTTPATAHTLPISYAKNKAQKIIKKHFRAYPWSFITVEAEASNCKPPERAQGFVAGHSQWATMVLRLLLPWMGLGALGVPGQLHHHGRCEARTLLSDLSTTPPRRRTGLGRRGPGRTQSRPCRARHGKKKAACLLSPPPGESRPLLLARSYSKGSAGGLLLCMERGSGRRADACADAGERSGGVVCGSHCRVLRSVSPRRRRRRSRCTPPTGYSPNPASRSGGQS